MHISIHNIAKVVAAYGHGERDPNTNWVTVTILSDDVRHAKPVRTQMTLFGPAALCAALANAINAAGAEYAVMKLVDDRLSDAGIRELAAEGV